MPITYGNLFEKLRNDLQIVDSFPEMLSLLGVADPPQGADIDERMMVPVDILLRLPVILHEIDLAMTLHGDIDPSFSEIVSDLKDECFEALATPQMLGLINRAAMRLSRRQSARA